MDAGSEHGGYDCVEAVDFQVFMQAYAQLVYADFMRDIHVLFLAAG
jgi:hypothetical protein